MDTTSVCSRSSDKCSESPDSDPVADAVFF
jgi:hypothetical protein